MPPPIRGMQIQGTMVTELLKTPMHRLDDAAWQRRIAEIGDEAGYFEHLGARHGALFCDEEPVLLVTFESRPEVRARGEAQLPLGLTLAREKGWSSLTLLSEGDTWFRDPAVYGFFDRLIDDGFFEDFDRIVFYGAGPGGYAAAAYSVAAPGCTVIAVQPQATLDPRLAGWDDRFRPMRRISFADRYGYAPDMIEGAGRGFVLFDPLQRLDAMHAALLRRPHVTLLPCPALGDSAAPLLEEMGILGPILTLACEGRFTPAAFWRLYRARRDLPRYLRGLSARLEAAGRPWLDGLLCRNAALRLDAPRFRARQATLEQHLAEQGRALPPPRARGA